MFRFQYHVVTKATPQTAWDVFCDWSRWKNYANIYGDIRWTEGEPWRIGSRMEIEVLRPVEVVIDHLIISCEPPREVGWIDKALGITIQQWVEFEKHGVQETRVLTWGELAPAGMKVGGRAAEQLISRSHLINASGG